jgi:hypothetical protein
VSGRAAPWIAVASLFGLVVLSIFLAASLGQVTLTEGNSFDETLGETTPLWTYPHGSGGLSPLRAIDYILAYGPFGLVVLGILVYVISQFKTRMVRHRRRGALPAILAVAALMLIIGLVARQQILRSAEGEAAAPLQAEQTAPAGEPAAVAVGVPVEPDTPTGEARATSVLLQVAFGLLALGACAGLIVAAMQLRPSKPKAPPLRESDIRDSVDNALRKLRLGRDAAGVVEECYRDMVRAFAASSGVDPSPLTPREFARSLESMGLGGEPLEELTSLFELVRYGRRPDEPLAPRALRCMMQLHDGLLEAPEPAS